MSLIIKRKSIDVFIVVMISLVALILIMNNYYLKTQQSELIKEKLVQEASAHFNNIVDTRSWNSRYQGVYVKPYNEIKPNAYLNDNTLKDADGNQLIKINPAWMTRQISEISNSKRRYYYRITSLKPLNPNNKADNFETKALSTFESSIDKDVFYQFSDDGLYFDFMGKLTVEKSCLACHEQQGYKEGDIRGGIRVSIPSDIYLQEINLLKQRSTYTTVTIVLVAIVMIGLFIGFSRLMYRKQNEIKGLNENLEKKVTERTNKLNEMFQHEKYIKEVLRTVADVNEILLASYSFDNSIKEVVSVLANHKHYHFLWVGLVKDNLLEVTHKSHDYNKYINQVVYDLNDEKSLDLTAVKAIKSNCTIIEQIDQTETSPQARREGDFPLYWNAAVPLMTQKNNELFGIINVFTGRKKALSQKKLVF